MPYFLFSSFSFKGDIDLKKKSNSFPQQSSPQLMTTLKIMSVNGLCDKVIVDQSPPHISQSLGSWFNIQLSAPKSIHSELIYRHFQIIRY